MASVAGRLSVIGWRLPGIFERFGRVTRVAGGARRSAVGLRSRVRLRAAPVARSTIRERERCDRRSPTRGSALPDSMCDSQGAGSLCISVAGAAPASLHRLQRVRPSASVVGSTNLSSVAQRLLTRSESLVSSASAIRLAVGIVGECQPRSISPRYLASIRGMRWATWSSVSPRRSRVSRIASPSLRESGSARVRLGKDHRRVAGHVPASLCARHPAKHSTCSPLLGRLCL